MKINDDHMYHGAALAQIAEHPHFTAVNAFNFSGVASRCAFRVNDDIGVYLKYSSKSSGTFTEYMFTFRQKHRDELEALRGRVAFVFLALVCVEDREICCLPYERFQHLLNLRRKAKGSTEAQYTLFAALPPRSKFRVYVNAPGKKKAILGEEMLISRRDFPNSIF